MIQYRYYPLRPELIESTYHQYRTTKDRSWLAAGEMFLVSLEENTHTECGYASVSNLETMEVSIGISLSLRLEGLFLYTGGVLFRVKCCIRYPWCSSVISFDLTSLAYNMPIYSYLPSSKHIKTYKISYLPTAG